MMRKLTFMMISLFAATMMMAEEVPTTVEVDIDNTDWTVTTQTETDYGYVPDGSTGKPEDLFDNDPRTFLSLVKPGKNYGEIPSQSADFLPSFTIDMQTEQVFDYIKWQHRTGNSYIYLRVFGIKLEGSNNLEEGFTLIGEPDEILWIPNVGGYVGSASAADPTLYTIPVPQSSYRYVKVTPVMWSDRYHGEHPDFEGDGASSGSTMQIAEFGLGKLTQAGISKLAHSSINVYPTQVRAGQPISIVLGDESTNASVSVSTLLGVKLNDKHVSGRQVEQTIATKGVYIIEVKKNAEKYVTKVVVK